MAEPPKLRLTPARLKTAVMALGSLVLTWGGIMMIRDGEAWGWLVVLFFAACAVVIGAMLLPGCSYLELRTDGFTICSLWRPQTYRWQDVGQFSPGRIGINSAVVFDMSPDYQPGQAARGWVKVGLGHEGALPDTYGRSADELATLMNEWRERHGRG